jgi:hypothetical protein
MKKFKWPWPFKKKEVKYGPIDLSDFKEDLEPWLIAHRAVNKARKQLEEHCIAAHTAFWKKINEIVGYDLPGNWTFDASNFTVIPKGDNEEEEVKTPEPSSFPSYEEHWKGMLATFYKDKN